eukprot:Rmarinus@m.18843
MILKLASRWKKEACPDLRFTSKGYILSRPPSEEWPESVPWRKSGLSKLSGRHLVELCCFFHRKLSLVALMQAMETKTIDSVAMDLVSQLQRNIENKPCPATFTTSVRKELSKLRRNNFQTPEEGFSEAKTIVSTITELF